MAGVGFEGVTWRNVAYGALAPMHDFPRIRLMPEARI